MKSLELLPTKENLLKTLQEDILKRNQDVVSFIEFLSEQENPLAISIDGKWGSGKTFFTKHTILGLSALNEYSPLNEEMRKDICSALKINTDEKKNFILPIYYDAWENDNDTDPVFSIIYEIAKQIDDMSFFEKQANVLKTAAKLFNLLRTITLKHITFNIEGNTDVFSDFTTETLQSKFKAEKELNESMKQFFEDARIERVNKIIIFVDELDRCKPSYAVKVLEQIKHFFKDENLIFVFSINKDQLQHTIKKYYGYDFNANKYLDRFFDFSFKLGRANVDQFHYSLGLYGDTLYSEICKRTIEMFNFELREQLHFCKQLEITVKNQIEKCPVGFPDENGRTFITCYIVPLMIGLNMADISKYQAFISGNAPSLLINFFEGNVSDYFLRRGLRSNESFEGSSEEGIIEVSKSDLVTSIYHAIFKFDSSAREIRIGSMAFYSTSKALAERYASILSPRAIF